MGTTCKYSGKEEGVSLDTLVPQQLCEMSAENVPFKKKISDNLVLFFFKDEISIHVLLRTPLCLIPDSLSTPGFAVRTDWYKSVQFMIVCQQTRPKVKVLLLSQNLQIS